MPRFSEARIRALCHNRLCDETDRIEVVRGSIAERDVVAAAIAGVTHVVHLATCKETPDDVMDVTVKGLFWLLEEFRASDTARQFILIGGDAGIGHFFYRHDGPITEDAPHMAYPGCYALSKVLEEVMLEQFGIQYGTNGCCLRAPWIMEKDDFNNAVLRRRRVRRAGLEDDGARGGRKALRPGRHGAAAARRRRAAAEAQFRACRRSGLGDPGGDRQSARRSGSSSTSAWTGRSTMARSPPISRRTRGLDSIDIPSQFHSNWMDNSKAKYLLDWQPEYDLEMLIDSAWQYERSQNDPRIVWYPG